MPQVEQAGPEPESSQALLRQDPLATLASLLIPLALIPVGRRFGGRIAEQFQKLMPRLSKEMETSPIPFILSRQNPRMDPTTEAYINTYRIKELLPWEQTALRSVKGSRPDISEPGHMAVRIGVGEETLRGSEKNKPAAMQVLFHEGEHVKDVMQNYPKTVFPTGIPENKVSLLLDPIYPFKVPRSENVAKALQEFPSLETFYAKYRTPPQPIPRLDALHELLVEYRARKQLQEYLQDPSLMLAEWFTPVKISRYDYPFVKELRNFVKLTPPPIRWFGE